jgi:hypothetical protein
VKTDADYTEHQRRKQDADVKHQEGQTRELHQQERAENENRQSVDRSGDELLFAIKRSQSQDRN